MSRTVFYREGGSLCFTLFCVRIGCEMIALFCMMFFGIYTRIHRHRHINICICDVSGFGYDIYYNFTIGGCGCL